MKQDGRQYLAALGFATGSLILAFEPLIWLGESWTGVGANPTGPLIGATCLALFAWSLSSAPAQPANTRVHSASLLLLLAAGLRLLSQVLDINVIGGAALAIDLFALAHLARLDQRARAVSPLWLSVLFLFALPVERVVQRLIGYPLQEISAALAHRLLDLWAGEVRSVGLRLIVEGRDVLVDLPCSGTAGLVLSGAFFAGLCSVLRAPPGPALRWGLATLCLSVICNALRISLLATGLVYRDRTGIDVMAQPWHDAIGYATLTLSVLPVALWFRPPPAAGPQLTLPQIRPGPVPAAAFAAAAILIVSLSPRPMDVSAPVTAPQLPAQLGGEMARPLPLSSQEQAFFATYGGTARKAQFGPLGVTYVTTTSPLRHLHPPDICLAGLGFEVRFAGTRFHPVPSAIYHATGPEGGEWELAVSFIGPSGEVSPGVAEMAWAWLNGARGRWASVQRITPRHLPRPVGARLEHALLAALDIQTSKGDL